MDSFLPPPVPAPSTVQPALDNSTRGAFGPMVQDQAPPPPAAPPAPSSPADLGIGAAGGAEMFHRHKVGEAPAPAAEGVPAQILATNRPDETAAVLGQYATNAGPKRVVLAGFVESLGQRLAQTLPEHQAAHPDPPSGPAAAAAWEMAKFTIAVDKGLLLRSPTTKRYDTLYRRLVAKGLPLGEMEELQNFVASFAAASQWVPNVALHPTPDLKVTGVDETPDGVRFLVAGRPASWPEIVRNITTDAAPPVAPTGPELVLTATGRVSVISPPPDPATRAQLRTLHPSFVAPSPRSHLWMKTAARPVPDVESTPRVGEGEIHADPAMGQAPGLKPGNRLVLTAPDPKAAAALGSALRSGGFANVTQLRPFRRFTPDGDPAPASGVVVDLADSVSRKAVAQALALALATGQKVGAKFDPTLYTHDIATVPAAFKRVSEEHHIDAAGRRLVSRTVGGYAGATNRVDAHVPRPLPAQDLSTRPTAPSPAGGANGDAVVNGDIRLLFAHAAPDGNAQVAGRVFNSKLAGRHPRHFAVLAPDGETPVLSLGTSSPHEAERAILARYPSADPSRLVVGQLTALGIKLVLPDAETGRPNLEAAAAAHDVLRRVGLKFRTVEMSSRDGTVLGPGGGPA